VGSSSSQADNDDRGTVEEAAAGTTTTTAAATSAVVVDDNEEGEKKEKKVRFSLEEESNILPTTRRRPTISTGDAIRAYRLLVHAASIVSAIVPSSSSSSRCGIASIDEVDRDAPSAISIGWEKLSVAADVYRALLVASCLLLELLPPTSSSNDDGDGGDSIHDDKDDTTRSEEERLVRESTGSAERRVSSLVKFPPLCPVDDDDDVATSRVVAVPALSPSIENEILSTCRLSIRQLRTLEGMCAAKAIYSSFRHRRRRREDSHVFYATSTTTMTTTPAESALFDPSVSMLLPHHEGGDDIHDYDRPMSDLSDNYDWHDDGFLPPPSSYFLYADEGGSSQQSSPDSSSSCVGSDHSSNILLDCFHRQRYPTDPPSSKFEMSARTRDWIRGDRLISLNSVDYESPRLSRHDVHDVGNYERLCEDEEEDRGVRPPDKTTDDEDEDVDIDDGGENLDYYEDDGLGGGMGSISLNISPVALAIEEEILLDVMLADRGVSSSSSRSVHTSSSSSGHCSGYYHDSGVLKTFLGDSRRCFDSVKEQRKKKRQRKLAARRVRLAADNDAVRIDRTYHARRSPGAREGFLLLVHEECESRCREILGHLFHDGQKVDSFRIYARLHPSGWLSVEDRSIRRWGECRRDGDRDDVYNDESTNERNQQQQTPQPQQQQGQQQQQQEKQQRQQKQQQYPLRARPLSPRMRFFDFYIDQYASCSPWVRDGMTSFQFRLNNILFLGASSLYNQSFDIGTVNNNNNNNSTNNNHSSNISNVSSGTCTFSTFERAHLLFGIDEGTGGEFMDGFDWVNCIESLIAGE
jgi:hypothetical protein